MTEFFVSYILCALAAWLLIWSGKVRVSIPTTYSNFLRDLAFVLTWPVSFLMINGIDSGDND